MKESASSLQVVQQLEFISNLPIAVRLGTKHDQ